MSALFDIKGRVTGIKDVSYMVGRAPEKYRVGLLAWLLRERNSFVGGKYKGATKDGVFRRSLMRKQSLRGIPWERRVARVFRGEVKGAKQINGMYLEMGAGLKGVSDFVKGLRIMGTAGGGSISSSNYMVVPVYKNLDDKRAAYKQFRDMSNGDRLGVIQERGHILYVDKDRVENGASVFDSTLFIGVHRVDIKRKFDFEGGWEKRVPKAKERGQKSIDRVTNRLIKQNA